MRLVLRGVARFLQAYGFYPQIRELAKYMNTRASTVQWYAVELIEHGALERHKAHASRSLIRITSHGWKALRLEPLAPYAPRPAKKIRSKIEQKVVRAIASRVQAKMPDAAKAHSEESA